MTTMDAQAVMDRMTSMQEAWTESMKQMMTELRTPTVDPTATPAVSVKMSSSPKLELRKYMKMDKFSGGESEWQEWSFDFKTLTNSMNPAMEKWFTSCESPTQQTLTPTLLAQTYADDKKELDPRDLEIRSKDLFGILCTLTTGEAKSLIRSR